MITIAIALCNQSQPLAFAFLTNSSFHRLLQNHNANISHGPKPSLVSLKNFESYSQLAVDVLAKQKKKGRRKKADLIAHYLGSRIKRRRYILVTSMSERASRQYTRLCCRWDRSCILTCRGIECRKTTKASDSSSSGRRPTPTTLREL